MVNMIQKQIHMHEETHGETDAEKVAERWAKTWAQCGQSQNKTKCVSLEMFS